MIYDPAKISNQDLIAHLRFSSDPLHHLTAERLEILQTQLTEAQANSYENVLYKQQQALYKIIGYPHECFTGAATKEIPQNMLADTIIDAQGNIRVQPL